MAFVSQGDPAGTRNSTRLEPGLEILGAAIGKSVLFLRRARLEFGIRNSRCLRARSFRGLRVHDLVSVLFGMSIEISGKTRIPGYSSPKEE